MIRIEFLFYFEYIFIFLDKYSISPFNEVISLDHRGLFLDLRLKYFLKKNLHNYVEQNLIIEKTNELHKKLMNNNITLMCF